LVGSFAPGRALGATKAAVVADPIQPGDYVGVTADGQPSGCTLSFVYDGLGDAAGKVFMSLAAHCVDKAGDPVTLEDGTVFGKVALVGDENAVIDDYALIEVGRAFAARVSPAVKGYPSYPKGVTTAKETTTGDKVQISGYGIGLEYTAATREKRQAVLTFDSADQVSVAGPLIQGDSGGPLVHVPTGKALGLVSRICAGGCTEMGPSIQRVLAAAAAHGLPVVLRTV
jgi:hypothetical protein